MAQGESWFYVSTSVLLLVLMFLGFQQFYLHGRAYPNRELAPPVRLQIILHGIAMSAWVVLFVTQSVLIRTRRYATHMVLGKVGACLAAAIVLLGIHVGVATTRIAPPELVIWGLSPKQFLSVPVISVVLFGAFVGVGVANRMRAEIHRPMMLMATITAMPAAVSRITPLSELYQGTIFETVLGPFFMTVVIAALLPLVHRLFTRSIDRWYLAGFAVFAVVSALTMLVARTGLWLSFAEFLLKTI